MKKFLLTITIISALLTACSQESKTHTGETHMGEYTKVTLEEDLQSPDVTAIVELIDPLKNATLWIDNKQVASFVGKIAEFQPSIFGDVQCEIRAGDDIFIDTLELYIETGFIWYNSDGKVNGDKKLPIENGTVILTPSNVTLGNNDMIWAYNVRVPSQKTITFDYTSVLLSGSKKAELHFRLSDYADRVESHQYIDSEPEKWIDAPMELGHGIHLVYVCPSLISDKSRVTVTHDSDFSSGAFQANYQSITNWPSE